MKEPTNKTLFVAADLAEPRKTADRKRSRTTSDITRVKPAYVAGVAGCLGIGVGLVAPVGGSSSLATLTEVRGPGPLTPPHAARLTCASCHGTTQAGSAGFTERARDACEDCHGQHRSTRKPHQALRARGDLECVTCHTIHGPQSGVRLLPSGETRRYSTWGETVVPGVSFRSDTTLFVPTIPEKVCLQCHTQDADDPVARCRTAAAQGNLSPTVCFDEHVFALAEADPKSAAKPLRDSKPTKKPSQVCSDQHFADRPFAWEAAREALEVGPPPPETEKPAFAPVIGGVLAAVLGYAGTAIATRRRRAKTPGKTAAPARTAQKRLPLINTTTCLGCYACVDACPYGVLDVNRYVAEVIRPDACCGLVLCEQSCPNGSLKVSDEATLETSEFDGPRLAADLESVDVPGVFLAGDITGVPLIKSAIAQGVAVANSVAKKLGKPRVDGQVDTCVVGAGPAGISAMLRLKELGFRAVALEEGSVAQSIQNFPRGKLVFDQPLDLPVAGALWLRESTKEELLLHWTRIVRKEALDIREGRRMVGLDALGEGRGFVVRARSAGTEDVSETSTLLCRAVVLAIGQRGSPRKLLCAIPEDCEGMVHYHLADARSLAGAKVVIAGLGDVAMETAIALASQPRTQVTIVARAATYSRGQSRNISEVERLRKAGRLHIEFRSEIRSISKGNVLMNAGGTDRRIPADHLFVLIGSIPPWDTLAGLGIRRAERQPKPSEVIPRPYPNDAKTLRSET